VFLLIEAGNEDSKISGHNRSCTGHLNPGSFNGPM
jgi:hypothetical protein